MNMFPEREHVRFAYYSSQGLRQIEEPTCNFNPRGS